MCICFVTNFKLFKVHLLWHKVSISTEFLYRILYDREFIIRRINDATHSVMLLDNMSRS
jgi:hypothetical protein